MCELRAQVQMFIASQVLSHLPRLIIGGRLSKSRNQIQGGLGEVPYLIPYQQRCLSWYLILSSSLIFLNHRQETEVYTYNTQEVEPRLTTTYSCTYNLVFRGGRRLWCPYEPFLGVIKTFTQQELLLTRLAMGIVEREDDDVTTEKLDKALNELFSKKVTTWRNQSNYSILVR